MKKAILVFIPLLLIAGLGGTAWRLHRDKTITEQNLAASKAAEDSLRTRFDMALASIVEIQDSLSVIMPSESNVLEVSRNIEQNGAMTASRKDQVLRSISDLNDSIQRSKELIGRLEQRLKDRDMRVATLEKMVANLKRSVAQREEAIAELTHRVESLQGQVTNLQAEVQTGQRQIAEQQQVIEQKRREISTVHYLVNTRKRLQEMGVVQRAGGVLGVGKSSRLSGQFPSSYFADIDTDQQTVLSVNGRKPVVLSGQNNTSYQLVATGEESAELRIVDPQEFRKVRYLVIQVD